MFLAFKMLGIAKVITDMYNSDKVEMPSASFIGSTEAFTPS